MAAIGEKLRKLVCDFASRGIKGSDGLGWPAACRNLKENSKRVRGVDNHPG
jgi:hypothetical protein